MQLLDQQTIATKVLKDQLDAKDGQWWCWFEAEGSVCQSAYSTLAPSPSAETRMVCEDILKGLNRTSGFNGTWLVAATEPKTVIGPTEYACLWMIWLDADGDVKVPVEIRQPSIFDVMMEGKWTWVDAAYRAWHTAKDIEDSLELAPHQKKQYAKGEHMDLIDINGADIIGD